MDTAIKGDLLWPESISVRVIFSLINDLGHFTKVNPSAEIWRDIVLMVAAK